MFGCISLNSTVTSTILKLVWHERPGEILVVHINFWQHSFVPLFLSLLHLDSGQPTVGGTPVLGHAKPSQPVVRLFIVRGHREERFAGSQQASVKLEI